MFVHGMFARSIALMSVAALFACSGGAAEQQFPLSASAGTQQAADPSADEAAAARVTALVAPATTIDKCALASPCISGTNTGSGPGVFGTNSNGRGVSGVSTSGFGVYGKSSSSYGVYGISQYAGVLGTGNTYGVYGNNATSTGDAVYGANSGGGNALHGYAPSGGVGAFAQGSVGMRAETLATGGDVFEGTDRNLVPVFYVDDAGNIGYHGTLVKFLRVPGGVSVSAFAPTATRPSVEDTGTAQLIHGQAIVRLDPAFARAIDTTRTYQVFLTPGGDTRGLYVASKGPSSFVVREVQGGRATLDFDYHIYATALGQGQMRMGMAVPKPQMR
jgi:hypothetical protein